MSCIGCNCNNDEMEKCRVGKIPSTTLSRVVTKMAQREKLGLGKYGTTMDREDLTPLEWAIHLQEELMDSVLYSEKIISHLRELEGK